MSTTVLGGREPADQCGRMLDKTAGGCRLFVLCTRPRGHPNTGHEFVGSVAGEHVHIVWGEPDD